MPRHRQKDGTFLADVVDGGDGWTLKVELGNWCAFTSTGMVSNDSVGKLDVDALLTW